MRITNEQYQANFQMIPQHVVHLLSGGLDSVTLLYDLKHQGHSVHCVLFDYKQQHVQELIWAKHHCRRLNCNFTVVELPHLGGLNQASWVVPNRNAIFLSIAINIAARSQAQLVTIGCNKADAEMFPDCRQEFLKAFNAQVKCCGYDIEVCAPYLQLPKWQIGAYAKEFGVSFKEIWTCYQGGQEPCGVCPACKNLNQAANDADNGSKQ